jgi:hypothetical protein
MVARNTRRSGQTDVTDTFDFSRLVRSMYRGRKLFRRDGFFLPEKRCRAWRRPERKANTTAQAVIQEMRRTSEKNFKKKKYFNCKKKINVR